MHSRWRIEIYFAASRRAPESKLMHYLWMRELASAGERAAAASTLWISRIGYQVQRHSEMAAYGDLRPPAGSHWKWVGFGHRHTSKRMHNVDYIFMRSLTGIKLNLNIKKTVYCVQVFFNPTCLYLTWISSVAVGTIKNLPNIKNNESLCERQKIPVKQKLMYLESFTK